MSAERRSRRGLFAIAGVYVLAMGAVVLSPISYQLNRLTVRMYVVWTDDLDLPGRPLPEDFGLALNVLLFVPAGLLMVLLSRRSWWVAALLCLLVSTSIEAIQVIPFLGREASLSDVAANGAGGLVGALAGTYWRARRDLGSRTGRVGRVG